MGAAGSGYSELKKKRDAKKKLKDRKKGTHASKLRSPRI